MFEMMSIGGFSTKEIVIFAGILFLILAIIFHKYITALIYDFLIDGVLSMIDEPLDLIMDVTGIGSPVPWEPGDLIAAILIYKKERHITGRFWALFVGAEALAFGIEPLLEMLPGGSIIAAPIGWFFNVCPTITIVRFIAAKTDKAIKDEKLLDEEINLAQEVGVEVSKEDKIRKKIQHLINKEWPIEAIQMYKNEKPERRVATKLHGFMDTLINQTNSIINNIANQNIQAPPEIIAILEEGINESEQLLKQSKNYENRFFGFFKQMFGVNPDFNDIRNSINLAMQAKEVIKNAAQEFDDAFAQYQNQLNMENTDVKNTSQ